MLMYFSSIGVADFTIQDALHAAADRHQTGNLLFNVTLFLDYLLWGTHDGKLYKHMIYLLFITV